MQLPSLGFEKTNCFHWLLFFWGFPIPPKLPAQMFLSNFDPRKWVNIWFSNGRFWSYAEPSLWTKSLRTLLNGWMKLSTVLSTILRCHKHCVKIVQIRNTFWSVFSCIRTEYWKIRTRKYSVFGYLQNIINMYQLQTLIQEKREKIYKNK